MPFTDLLYLCGVVAAFAAFGLTLAWGELQTRNFVRPDEQEAAATTAAAAGADHRIQKAA